MADDSDVDPVGERSSGNDDRRQKLIVLGVLAFVFFLAWNWMSDDEGGESSNQQQSTQNDSGDGNQSGGSDEQVSLDMSGPSGRKAVKVLARDLTATKKRLERIQEESRRRDREAEQKLDRMSAESEERDRRLENKITEQLQDVVETMRSFKESQARRDYNEGIPDAGGSSGSDTPSLPGSDGGGGEGLPGGDGAGLSDEAGSASGDLQESRRSRPDFSYKPLYDAQPRTAAGIATKEAAQSSPSGSDNNVIKSGGRDNADNQESEEEPREDLVIGAGAMAKAVNLNGADCPIGIGSSRGGSGGANDIYGQAPVYIQLRGPFRGANNRATDIGSAQLLGFCTGIRNGGRARIKIERLQYNHAGETHHVDDVQATVIDNDRREQQLDINGTLVAEKGKDAFVASVLNGIKVAGQISVKSQFTETQSPQGDSTSSLTGNPEQAAASAFGQGISERLVQMYIDQLEQNVDVIHIPSGEDMLVVLSTPITIEDVKGSASNAQGGLADTR